GRLRAAKVVRNAKSWVPLEQIEGEPMRTDVQTAPSLDERDDRRDCQRALAHGGQALSDLRVIPVPGRLAPDLLLRVTATDPLDVLCAVLRARRSLVLPPLSRRVALGPEAPGVRLADDGAFLILEGRAVRL